ncbi:class III lanthionine synthetase LanKC [Kineosporia sp. J2-2]|uniref:non-specific serine/threonine protein kinase n=1 Tax=Kineosporia corallincola TaxID=2835133 RepID=A0ABS5TR04_9ACTN|nr:class III lanthionine synthetase LanKC [Kineosporia corallincola]MBT0773249.1 class III lanthionine synthetase LanKC [Kineosporia corallincola]
MDMRYVEFALAHPFFYDRLDRHGATGVYELDDDAGRQHWTQDTADGWRHLHPPHTELPEQGWKVHVSATLENAPTVLARVSRYCVRHALAFKFRPGRADLLRINLKYADRGSSGKFITVYPPDEHTCERVLHELDALVGGLDGPYVLSDLRWKDGPLYLRYGAFRPMLVLDEQDRLVPAVRRPNGSLAPDPRLPGFSPPAWVRLPPFVTSAREQLANSGGSLSGHRVIEALHFSNGGGVYLAERLRDGARVVLKEARPHAGLGPDGSDAVQRLHREHEQLRRLADVGSVVDVTGHVEHSGHHFLELEHVPGRSLSRETAARHPLTRADMTPEDVAAYRDWALDITRQIERAVAGIHARGQVHGDLHPGNVIVTPQGSIRFVDLEMSCPVGSSRPAVGGAPGYTAPDGRTGIPADRYSLACLKLALFIPLTMLLPLDRRAAGRLVEEAALRFGLDPSWSAAVLRELDGDHAVGDECVQVRDLVHEWPIDSADGVRRLESAISQGIWESLDLSRPHRMFPGDIRQFTHDALSIAHGACGVLLASRHGDRDAVLNRVETALHGLSPRPGLLDGITGIACAMDDFGRASVADRLYQEICTLPFDRLPGDLYGGLAGIGVGLLHRLDRVRDHQITDAIEAIRAVLRGRAHRETRSATQAPGTPPSPRSRPSGLLHGPTGSALFWLCSYETSGDPADLDLAQQALAADVTACVERPDGSLQIGGSRRTMPYLGAGSIGVALVAMRLLHHVDDEHLHLTVRKVIRLTRAGFTVQPGLFNGRAGYVLFLAAVLNSPFADERTRSDLIRHTRDLRLYALVHGTGIHLPGEQMLRASVDWASGSAGLLTALRAYAGAVHGLPAPAFPIPGLLTSPRRFDLTPNRSAEREFTR